MSCGYVMSADFRRLFPPERPRPHLLVVLGRWWLEITAVLSAVVVARTAVDVLGAAGASVLGAAVGIAVAGAAWRFDVVREVLLGGYQRLIVPHRARLGIVHSGATNRYGKLPTIIRSRCRADQVRLWLHLPAGIVIGDLAVANDVIASSCGAASVMILPDGPRQDRVVLVIVRPRWGWLTR
jgi:hypothetical protein